MIPTEIIPGIRRQGIKESGGGGEFICDTCDTLSELL
jgi:hypothetical protein